MSSPHPIFVLRSHNESVNALRFLSEHSLASGAADGSVIVWDMPTRRPALEFFPHGPRSILSLSVLPHRNRLITCGRDGTVKSWDIDSIDSAAKAWEKGPDAVLDSQFCHFCNAATDSLGIDRDIVLAPSVHESAVLVWDVRVPTKVTTMINPPPSPAVGMLSSLVYLSSGISTSSLSSSSPIVLAGYESGTILTYDLRSSTVLSSYSTGTEPVMALDAFVSPPKGLQTSQEADPSSVLTPRTSSSASSSSSAMAIDMPSVKSKSKTTVVCGGAGPNLDSIVYQHKPPTTPLDSSAGVGTIPEVSNTQVSRFTSNTLAKGIGGVRIRSDGRLIAAAHWDGSVRLMDSKKLKPVGELCYHRDSVYSVDFAPKDSSCPHLLASGSKDATIAIWDVLGDTYRS
jgi:WD40 repeat protein